MITMLKNIALVALTVGILGAGIRNAQLRKQNKQLVEATK